MAMEWDDLKHVAALAETGSVRRAGATLGVHGATVARHIERLEARIGAKLFARKRTGMEITPAGRRVVETFQEVSRKLELLEEAVRSEGRALSGRVELGIAAVLAVSWVVPRLAEFCERYPEIEVVLRDESIELLPGAPAAALVLTDDPPPDLVGRRLGWLGMRGYRSVNARADARVLGPISAAYRGKRPGADVDDLPAQVISASVLEQAAAAQAGLGVALLPCILGDAADGLTGVDERPYPSQEVWLLSHPESRGIARLNALIGYLQPAWDADRAVLEGRAMNQPDDLDA